MKRRVGTVLAVLLSAGLLFAAGQGDQSGKKEGAKSAGDSAGIPADGKTFTLQLALAGADANEQGVFIHEIKDQLEAKSNGKIKVDLYANAQLGGDRELNEGCQMGNIAMVVQATSPAVNFVKAVAVFDLPSAMTDVDKTYEAMKSPTFGTKIRAEYEKAGYKLLTIFPIGCRQMTSNKAVRQFEDFKGIKIRTMENPYHIAYWKALGANPTPLNFSELYIALQQGLVTAQENPPIVAIVTKLFEQQKYLINTNHIQFLTTVIMNKTLFDKMPASYQKLIGDVVTTAAVNNMNLMKANAQKNLDFLKSKGLEIIDLSPDVQKKMFAAAQPVYDMVRKNAGDELVDSLLKALGM